MAFHNREAIDSNDPRSAAEAAELEELLAAQPRRTEEEIASGMCRVIAWCLEGGTLARIGFRVHIAASKLRIDPTAPSLHRIAQLSGFGRSAANKHALEFSQLFKVRGPHDRTEENRQTLSEAWHDRQARRQGLDRSRSLLTA